MLRMPYSDAMNQKNGNFRLNVIRNKVRKSNKNVMSKYFRDYAYMIQILEKVRKLEKTYLKLQEKKHMFLVELLKFSCE